MSGLKSGLSRENVHARADLDHSNTHNQVATPGNAAGAQTAYTCLRLPGSRVFVIARQNEDVMAATRPAITWRKADRCDGWSYDAA